MQRVKQCGITCMPGVARERLLDHDDDDVDEDDDHYHDDNNSEESDEVARKHLDSIQQQIWTGEKAFSDALITIFTKRLMGQAVTCVLAYLIFVTSTTSGACGETSSKPSKMRFESRKNFNT